MTDQEALTAISENLKRLRGDLSYSEIGRRCNTTAAAISRIEKGTHMPGVGLLTRIAAALDCSIEELLKRRRRKTLKSA